MTLPNFLIIGAPKAGTTTIQNAFAQHPEFFISDHKDCGFWSVYGRQYEIKVPDAIEAKHRIIDDFDEYKSLFKQVRQQKASGETSGHYLSSDWAATNIQKCLPNVRLIVNLRQPVDRAYSAYMHHRRGGPEPREHFMEAIAEEQAGKRNGWIYNTYLDKGFYARSLQTYFRLFTPDQIHISLFEDLSQDPKKLFKQLFDFLEVNRDFVPDLSHQHNVSGVVRNPITRFLWTRSNELHSNLRPFVNPGVRHRLFEWLIHDVQKIPLDPDIRAELTEYYREDIELLQKLIKRDLSHWLQPPHPK